MLRTTNCYFYLLKQSNSHTIYCRITVNGKKKARSTGLKVNPSHWNQQTQRVSKSNPKSTTTNETLTVIENQVIQAENKLITTQRDITLDNILEIVDCGGYEKKTFLELFYNHNKKLKKLVEVDEYSEATYTKYCTMLKHTMNYLSDVYDKDDIGLSELNLEWVENFEHWFKTEAGISHNTTLKYLKFIKKIINIALRRDYLQKDPFDGFNRTKKMKVPNHLNIQELKKIEDYDFNNKRLEQVKDCFIFGCYTGLAYSDMASLDRGLDFWENENNIYLQKQRTKTGVDARMLLLPKAKKIYKKYESNKSVLPINTNQRMNTYLKEIQTLCRIPKNLTTHMARHTFATTICLENGLSIDTLQILLGHSDKRSTAHYGRVTATKITTDMEELSKRL